MLRRQAMFARCLVAALALVGFAAPALADTINDFDAPGTPWVGESNTGAGNAPIVVPSGTPFGNVLQLQADNIGGLLNTAAFDQTDPAPNIINSIQFHFQLPDEASHTGCCGQRADGFSVSIVNPLLYGTTGALATGLTAWERPQFPGSFAIGVDIFEGGGDNVFSINRNGVQLATATVNDSVHQLTTGIPNQARITLDIDNSGAIRQTIVSMEIEQLGGPTTTVFNNVAVDGAPPAGGRLAFGGRTGSAYTSVHIDNVNATAVAPPPGPPDPPPPDVPADFNFYQFQDPNTGNWNVYEVRGWGSRYGGAEPMARGYALARERAFAGAQGDLAAVGSQAENDFLRRIASHTDAWIGFTDNEMFGTFEGNFVWTNGDPVTYTNWGGGEPNNSGGEDATHLRGDGAWNDHKSNLPTDAGGTGSPSIRYIIEYPTNSPTPLTTLPQDPGSIPGISAGINEWNIREAKPPSGNLNNIFDTRAALTNPGSTLVDYTAPVVNLVDTGGSGNFPNDAPFQIGSDIDDVAVVAKRRINIAQSGWYTFGFNSDDGGELTLRDPSTGNIVPFELKGGAGDTIVSTYGSLIHDFNRGPGDSLGRVNLAPGQYDVEMHYWERGGGAEVEVFMAEGDHTGLNRSFTLLGGPPPPKAPVLIGPYGPNGEWVAYERDGTARTFDASRAEAASRDFYGIPGNLVAVGSGEENDFVYRQMGTGWIGLTDLESVSAIDGYDYSTLGTSEQGNTGGTSARPVASLPGGMARRGEGYRFVNGEPLTHSFWNASEPNDAGGEDAIEITTAMGGGAWNDLPAGTTAGQRDGWSRAGTVEYNLGTDQLRAIILPGLIARAYWATDGGIGGDPWGLRDTDSLIGSTGDPGRILGSAPVATLDLVDPDNSSGGIFPDNIPFPGQQAGDDNNIIVQVTGTMNVLADGEFVFEFRGDDGGRLRIDGQNIIIDDAFHGHSTGGPNGASGNVWLAAGEHSFEFVNFEAAGGWSAELSYAQVGNTQVLVGDPSQGIAADMVATVYKLSGNVDINNLAQTDQLIAGELHRQGGSPFLGIYSVPDFYQDGGTGHFIINDPFPGLPTTDDFVLEATGVVFIPEAGRYTFGFNTDDGGSLQIFGADLLSGTNEIGSTFGLDGILAYDANRGTADTLGVFDFAVPGQYELRFLMWERGGGAGAELFAAQGEFTSFDPGAFRLLGDVAGGGLAVYTNIPEPGTMALLGLGLLALVRRRRK